MKAKPVRVLCLWLAAGAIIGFAPGCVSKANDDAFFDSSTNPHVELDVLANDQIFAEGLVATILSDPVCGFMKTEFIKNGGAFSVNRMGVAAGTYYFTYGLSVYSQVANQLVWSNSSARASFTLGQTLALPDGTPPCGGAYQAFLNSAKATAGSITIKWVVPEGALFADSYTVRATDAGPYAASLGSATFASPGGNGEQTVTFSYSAAPELISVFLNTIMDGKVVYTDKITCVGIDQGEMILVDDYVKLAGSNPNATVSPLANDIDPTSGVSPLQNVQIALLNTAYPLVAQLSGDKVNISAAPGSNIPTGQYRVTMEVSKAGYSKAREYIYVDFSASEIPPPTVNDDSFSGLANTDVGLDVLANDSAANGGALTITEFGQPGGGAVVSSSGKALAINGPAGSYTFGYTAADELGNKGSAKVSVTLSEPNKPTQTPAPTPAPPLCDIWGNPPGCIQQCPNPAMAWPNCA